MAEYNATLDFQYAPELDLIQRMLICLEAILETYKIF